MTRGKNFRRKNTHIGVDTNGLPHAIFAGTANITDRTGALEMIRGYGSDLSGHCVKVLCDGGYTGKKFASGVLNLIDAEVEIVKRNDCTLLLCCQSVGLLNALFRGWINAVVCGKIVNVKYKLPYKW
jgi:transposase